MNAITRILMNAVRAYNAERLVKVTKIADFGNEDRGAGVYADKENNQFLVFFVLKGEHQWECNYGTPTKVEASNIAQAFADGDIKIGSELTEMQAQGLAEQFGYPTPIKASDAQTETLDTEGDVEHDVDDDLESGEVSGADQLQGIDRHDDPFYDTKDADDLREHSQTVDVEPPSGEVRECTNEDCGWVGQTDRMCGTTGPLCERCGDTTEPQVTESQTDVVMAPPRSGQSVTAGSFKLHPHQQQVVDYINEQAMDTLTIGDVSTARVQVYAEKKPKIKKGRQAQRRAAKRAGNQKPRGANARPSGLLDKMFGRNPITIAE